MKKFIVLFSLISMFSGLKAQTEVTFFTSQGRFVVEIYDNIVPITGGNFLDLVDSNFYDGVIFHRVINNFMIQGGDPTGTGSGGPGYSIPDEFDSSLSNVQKTISMANSGPNTGGSQFFINLVDNTYLDFDKPPSSSKHPVFGMTTQNFNIVQDIGLVATNAQDRPLVDVVMDSIRRGGDLTVGLDRIREPIFRTKIYPNPGDANSLLEIESAHTSTASIRVFDSQGRLLSIKELSVNKGRNFFRLKEVSNTSFNQGVYHVNINQDKESEYVRLFIK